MSLDQILMLPPGYGFDGGAAEPTVYTLTFGNVEATGAWDNFSLSPVLRMTVASSGGNGTTPNIAFTNGIDTHYDAETLATNLQGELETICGGGLVTVSGSGTGESRILEVTFDASLTVTSFTFAGSSVWKGTCVLAVNITQEGADEVPGSAEQFTVTASGANEEFNFGELGAATYLIGFDGDGNIASAPSVTGYSIIDGGSGFGYVTYLADTDGTRPSMEWYPSSSYGSSGNVSVTNEGSDATPATSESQEVSCSPLPYEGAWTLSGNSVQHTEDATTVQSVVDTAFGMGVITVSGSGTFGLSDGSLTFQWTNTGAIDNAILAALVGTLATPEITHSIS